MGILQFPQKSGGSNKVLRVSDDKLQFEDVTERSFSAATQYALMAKLHLPYRGTVKLSYEVAVSNVNNSASVWIVVPMYPQTENYFGHVQSYSTSLMELGNLPLGTVLADPPSPKYSIINVSGSSTSSTSYVARESILSISEPGTLFLLLFCTHPSYTANIRNIRLHYDINDLGG